MKPTRKLFIAAICGGAVAVAYFYQSARTPGSDGFSQKSESPAVAARDSAEDEISKIQHQLAQLRIQKTQPQEGDKQSIRRIEHRLNTLQSRLDELVLNRHADAQAAAEAIEEFDTTTGEPNEEAMRVQVEQHLSLLDQIAKAEGADVSSTEQAKSEIYQSFERLTEAGLSVSAVECASSLCKASFVFSGDATEFDIQQLQSASPWDSETLIWIANENEGQGLIYIARDGHGLPSGDTHWD